MCLAKWSVENRVSANMLCILLLFGGFGWAASQMRLSLFPEITTNFILVRTVDPQTSAPADVERLITIPIEQQLNDVSRVKKITSVSQDNVSSIFIELDPAVSEVSDILNEVRQAVDRTRRELPLSAEPPVVESFDIPMPFITFSVVLPEGVNVNSYRENFERLKRRLLTVGGVSDVLVDGLEMRELWVEWDPLKMEMTRTSVERLAQAIRTKNLDRVGGKLETVGGEKIVRLLGEVLQPEELEDIPLGQPTALVRHVATVRETSAIEQTSGTVNLRRAVTFTIVKRKGADAISTVQRAKKIFNEERRFFPENFETLAVGDGTKYIQTRLDTVLKNGIQALLLVTVMLILLVNWRLALVVAVGIPISFAGVLIVLFLTGNTINLLTMFAMIMALGMVVDDAIVVSENVYRHYESGMDRVKAAIIGTKEVFWPVLGSVSTTIAAFLPLILGEGILGKFLAVVPVVVITALTFSVLQCFLIVPSHLADFVRKTPEPDEAEQRRNSSKGIIAKIKNTIRLSYAELRLGVERGIREVIQIYLDILKSALRLRYIISAGFVALLLGTFALIGSGALGFRLFGGDFADIVVIKTDLPTDATLQDNEEIIRRLERRVIELLPPDDLVSTNARIGARMDPTNSYLEIGSNLATLNVDINEQSRLCRRPSVIERELQKLLEEFPEFTKATAAKQGGGPPTGKPVNVEITGQDFDALLEIASEFEKRLKSLPGLRNIGNDFGSGKSQWLLRVDAPKAASLGLTTEEAATLVQSALLGLEISRLRWGNEEVAIRVRMDERFRRDPEALLGLRTITRDGRVVALESFVTVQKDVGAARIKRQNKERMITVSADLDTALNSSFAVNREIARWVPEILADYPGYSVSLTGENEDTEGSLRAMSLAAMLALILIYGILAAVTNSFIQPLIIMIVIPFGIIGVCVGLVMMGQPLGLMSIMGTIALAGIVVNNSLLLVDFINRYHAIPGHAQSRWGAILRAGRARFRPVFLTVATTVIGLMGLATTTSGQEQFLAPMAQAIVWGLCFATGLTLVFIPCLYAITDDLKFLKSRRART